MNPRTATACLATILLSASVLASCGGGREAIRVTAFTDPAYAGRSFAHVAVHVPTNDLIWAERVESKIAEELRDRGIRATEGLSILAPTREWTDSARTMALRSAGVSALVRMVEMETWKGEQKTPGKATTTVERERRPGKDSTSIERERETATTVFTEPTVVVRTWVKYEIRLVEIASGATAWIGMAWMARDTWGLDDFRSQLVGTLLSDGIVAARAR